MSTSRLQGASVNERSNVVLGINLFDYPRDIRRVIYTTNAIESVNRSLRKVIKTKAVFPDEESVFKLECIPVLAALTLNPSPRAGEGL